MFNRRDFLRMFTFGGIAITSMIDKGLLPKSSRVTEIKEGKGYLIVVSKDDMGDVRHNIEDIQRYFAEAGLDCKRTPIVFMGFDTHDIIEL